VDKVLRDLIGTEVYCYVDDLIIFSSTPEEHAKSLEHALERLERANLKLQPQVEYLGCIISREGINANPDKMKAVLSHPVPKKKTLREVRSFLGLTGFYHKMTPNCAQRANPLTQMIRKNGNFVRTQRPTRCF
jgi:hypothetical protein